MNIVRNVVNLLNPLSKLYPPLRMTRKKRSGKRKKLIYKVGKEVMMKLDLCPLVD